MPKRRELHLEVPNDDRAPSRVRHALGEQFAELGEALPVLGVVASEMVTNAVLHGAPPIRVDAFPIGAGVRVQVHDDRRDIGAPKAESRGLRLIDALAADWGVAYTEAGKCFWADVARPTV
jgi:two-component sensor histidine kinase